MSRAGSIYNKLKNPIAVLSRRDAYQHLCVHCNLDANSNDVFHHVHSPESALEREYCRVIELGDTEWLRNNLKDYLVLVSLTKTRVVN